MGVIVSESEVNRIRIQRASEISPQRRAAHPRSAKGFVVSSPPLQSRLQSLAKLFDRQPLTYIQALILWADQSI